MTECVDCGRQYDELHKKVVRYYKGEESICPGCKVQHDIKTEVHLTAGLLIALNTLTLLLYLGWRP